MLLRYKLWRIFLNFSMQLLQGWLVFAELESQGQVAFLKCMQLLQGGSVLLTVVDILLHGHLHFTLCKVKLSVHISAPGWLWAARLAFSTQAHKHKALSECNTKLEFAKETLSTCLQATAKLYSGKCLLCLWILTHAMTLLHCFSEMRQTAVFA